MTLPFSPFSPKLSVKLISIPLPCSSTETSSEKSLILLTSPSSMVTSKSYFILLLYLTETLRSFFLHGLLALSVSPATPFLRIFLCSTLLHQGFVLSLLILPLFSKANPGTLLVLTVPSMTNFQQGERSMFPSRVVSESASKYIFFLILIPIQSSWKMNYLFFPQLDLWIRKTRTKSFHLN